MNGETSHIPSRSQGGATRSSSTTPASAGGARVQLKEALVCREFAEQEAMLTPRAGARPVQKRELSEQEAMLAPRAGSRPVQKLSDADQALLNEALNNCHDAYSHIFVEQQDAVMAFNGEMGTSVPTSMREDLLASAVKKAVSAGLKATVGRLPAGSTIADAVAPHISNLVLAPPSMPNRERFIEGQLRGLREGWNIAERQFNHDREVIARRPNAVADAQELDRVLQQRRAGARGQQYMATLSEWTRLLHLSQTPHVEGSPNDPDPELADGTQLGVLHIDVELTTPTAGPAIQRARLTGIDNRVKARLRDQLSAMHISTFTGMLMVEGHIGQTPIWIARGRSREVDLANIRLGHGELAARVGGTDSEATLRGARDLVATLGRRTIGSLGDFRNQRAWGES